MADQFSRRTVTAGLSAALVSQVVQPARADITADIQLVLAVDVSGSVSAERFELQRRGYAAAFRVPQVLATIKSGRTGAIAVTMMQWTGPAMQTQVVKWTRVHDQATIAAFADAIDGADRQLYSGGTSISGAIDHALSLFPSSPYAALRRVIDVSGDGANNRGRRPAEARDDAVKADVTINGLPIMALEPNLDDHYRDHVIGGTGAFMIAAESYETFGDAVRRKLIQEIA
jgi:hypothetical protein